MKAEDTIMHLDDIDEGRMPDSYDSQRKALEKQAEISFNIGKNEGVKMGMKEVIYWIKQHSRHTYGRAYGELTFSIEDWENKYKEWGIE